MTIREFVGIVNSIPKSVYDENIQISCKTRKNKRIEWIDCSFVQGWFSYVQDGVRIEVSEVESENFK